MLPKINLKQLFNQASKNATLTNILIVGALTLVVKGLGFFKEIIIADNFGLSELLDTFYIAILVPGFISNVFLGGFKSVFIPNYLIELKTGNNIKSFQSTCFLITLVVALAFCLIAIGVTDIYLETFFSGHNDTYYQLIKDQFYLVLPCIVFWGLTSLINGLLNIDKEFTFSTINAIFIPICIIICIVFFKEDLGTQVLAMGTLIGTILSFIFLIVVALNRKILSLGTPDFKSVNIIILFKQLPAKLSSNILTGTNEVVDQYFAAQLIIGSIAALNYGVKIPMFAISIITMALGTVLLPYFTEKAIQNKTKSFEELNRILALLLISTTIVAIVLITISTPLISLIFERNAFTSEDTQVVSKIQQMYLIQIPVYIITIIMVRFLEAINKNGFMAFAALLCLCLNIVFNYILVERMGVYGLALSTSLVAILNSIFLYLYIRHLKKLNAAQQPTINGNI